MATKLRGGAQALENRVTAILKKALASSAFGGWRDPDSNRGHHDFQSAAGTRTTGAVCRGLLELRVPGDAGRFQAIPGALGHRAGGGDPIAGQRLARKRTGSVTVMSSSCASSKSRSSETIASACAARASATR
jgi:hypothetical protein